MIKQNQKALNTVGIFIDAVCIILSLIIAWVIRFKTGIIHVDGWHLTLKQYVEPAYILIPLYIFIYYNLKLYTPQRTHSLFKEISKLFKANILGILIFTLGLYVFKQLHYSRYFIFIFAITNTALAVVERSFIRYILRNLRRKGKNLKHILLVGYGNQTIEFMDRIEKNKHWGYNVVGILDDKLGKNTGIDDEHMENAVNEIIITAMEEIASSKSDKNKGKTVTKINDKNNNIIRKHFLRYKNKVIGKIDKLHKILSSCDIDEVFITIGIKEYDKMEKIINVCEKNGIRAQIIPDYYRYIPAKPYVEELEGLPIINIRYIPLDNIINKFLKRTFDIIVAGISLLVFSPIMITTALVIKITSPGPVIFRQERVGMNRRKFEMYKFRSMHVQKDEDEKTEWTSKGDPRKTKFGSFIRKTSIDELPQLLNVFKGDMSLIGPRPERPYFVDKFKEEIPKYMVKHQVRPGMTGWAQVNGYRGDTSIVKRIEHDIYYIENWSLSLDIKIILFTVFRGFVNKNAY